ncbi:hypothetical protein FQA47_009372 [Oryzias melastigma]|uniref:Uncharacterized protein n=1 Tax=Oryzias melastigma TaxID=30732 RepID=A0A834CJA5_ORYME|nr:hypothetical protein FQA47_009372 [Oryzias melastigma]
MKPGVRSGDDSPVFTKIFTVTVSEAGSFILNTPAVTGNLRFPPTLLDNFYPCSFLLLNGQKVSLSEIPTHLFSLKRNSEELKKISYAAETEEPVSNTLPGNERNTS